DWLELAREKRQIILDAFTLNQGTKLLPKDTSIVIYSTNDPLYIMMQQNNNFDQTAATTFRSGMNPGNGLEFTTLYSPNGEIRMRHTYSAYWGTSTVYMLEEMYQQYTNTNDPYTGGGIKSWVLNFQTGVLNELGLHMLRMAYIANLGTTFR
ncbi:MAG: hypothetical protein K0B08_05990, partial [Bacteroidales bacterium]|nr:hypothetical protein [Bacteroidales bacterium]